MSKVLGFLFVLVSSFVITFFCSLDIALAATSESEPNNRITDADVINVDEDISGKINGYSDEDYFKFTLPSDGYVRIEADNHTDYSTSFDVTTIEDEYINSFITDEKFSGKTTATIGLAKGTYYIKAEGYSVESNDAYRFRVNFTPTSTYEKEPNNDFSEATPLTVNKTYNGVLSDNFVDRDYYKFTNSKAGKYTFSLGNNGLYNKTMTIYDEKRNYMYQFDTDRLLKGNSELTSGLPAGTFYILIDGSDVKENAYEFKVTFTASDYYEKEFNDDFDTATPIQLNQYYNGFLTDYYDDDCYKFELKKDDTITLITPQGKEKLVMILNREDGQVGYIETEKDKKGDAKLVKKLKAGIYYVKFTDNDEENEAYRFKISTSTSSTVTRLEGPNRYDTAVAISKKGWSTSNTVILTTGINFPDALAGAPLAYKENAPILLTQQNKLTEVTKTELKRLKAKKVIILGSDDVVSKSINTTIKGMGISTERIGGKDRYETAALIAKKLYSSKAVLAYGLNFPDALAIAPYAARNGIPILLTKTDSLPTYTKTALKGKSSAIIVGSSDVVSKKVESSLSVSSVKRYGGDNRYDTAKLIIENLKLGTNSAYVATGLNFPDALAGSALAAKHNAPILLVNGNKMPDSTKSLISKYKSFTLLGGSDVVGNEIKKILE